MGFETREGKVGSPYEGTMLINYTDAHWGDYEKPVGDYPINTNLQDGEKVPENTNLQDGEKLLTNTETFIGWIKNILTASR